MNEIEQMIKYQKELNEYVDMLVTGDYPKDYIVGKVKLYGQRVANQAEFAYDYKKKHGK